MGKPIGDMRAGWPRCLETASPSRRFQFRDALEQISEFEVEVARRQLRRRGSCDHHEVASHRCSASMTPEPLTNPAFHARSHHGIAHSATHGDPEPRLPVAGGFSLLRDQ